VLSYKAVDDVLGALGAFLQRYKMSEATFMLGQMDVPGVGEDVSTGRIERDVFAVDKGGGLGRVWWCEVKTGWNYMKGSSCCVNGAF
jgi:hypothetical protein